MSEHHSKVKTAISKTQHHYQVDYVSTRHENSKTDITTYYLCNSSLHLKGDGLKAAGFETRPI